jgi:hypothetical protein
MGVSAGSDEQYLTDGRVLRDFIMKWKNSDGRNAVVQEEGAEPRFEDVSNVALRVAHFGT